VARSHSAGRPHQVIGNGDRRWMVTLRNAETEAGLQADSSLFLTNRRFVPRMYHASPQGRGILALGGVEYQGLGVRAPECPPTPRTRETPNLGPLGAWPLEPQRARVMEGDAPPGGAPPLGSGSGCRLACVVARLPHLPCCGVASANTKHPGVAVVPPPGGHRVPSGVQPG